MYHCMTYIQQQKTIKQQWVSNGGRRCPVAMLQLATQDGHCALIRLYLMKSIPQSLRDILEDKR